MNTTEASPEQGGSAWDSTRIKVVYFDHHGWDHDESVIGSIVFPELGDLPVPVEDIATATVNIMLELADSRLGPCGCCYAICAEGVNEPTRCARTVEADGPWGVLYEAIDRLFDIAVEHRNEHGSPRFACPGQLRDGMRPLLRPTGGRHDLAAPR